MSFQALAFSRNELLSALPLAEVERLRPLLTRVRWISGQSLHEAGERIDQVFFVEAGFVSMVAEAGGDDIGTEVGLIGREGMVGLPVLLRPRPVSFDQAMVRMPGAARRMTAEALRDSLDALPALRQLLLQAWEAFMAHDRVDGDGLPLTQDLLSKMLAVRRPGVTVALQPLRIAGAVSQRRGSVLICDRPGLVAAACGCHGRVKALAEAVAAGDA